MRKITPLITLLCLFSFWATASFATPEKSRKQRRIFIGTSDKFFYTYLIETWQPGNYFQYITNTYLCKHSIAKNKVVERIALGQNDHSDHNAAYPKPDWRRKDKVEPFNLEKYLVDEKARWIFPSYSPTKRADPYVIDEKGVFWKNAKTREQELIFSWEDEKTTATTQNAGSLLFSWALDRREAPSLVEYMKAERNEHNRHRILEIYSNKIHFFLLVEYGDLEKTSDPVFEGSYCQSILPIEKAAVKKAYEKLVKTR